MPSVIKNNEKNPLPSDQKILLKDNTRSKSISLADILQGQSATIVELVGGGRFRKRAAEMGFQVDQEITVLVSHSHGPLLIRIRDSRVAIGQGVMTPVTAFTFMAFTLIYVPCIATLAIIRKETGSWKHRK
ncbi:MAG: FeoA domain-containing protein [Candidatus Ranarchaeia archaeon]